MRNSLSFSKFMAQLTEEQKAALREAAAKPVERQAPPPVVPLDQYLRHASQMAALATRPKQIRFEGKHWKL